MTTFSDPLFSATRYASFRPLYPATLYTQHLLPYHQGARTQLLDLGCGPGTVTRPLSSYFTSTLGTDPSSQMLETARSLTPLEEYPTISYACCPAENIPLPDASVDMAVAAQAAHWFDQPKWWKEMARVVRPGGTVAVWGYRDFLFPRFPKASLVLRRYTYGPEKLGPLWQQPGRAVVEGRYRDVIPPPEDWEGVRRLEFEPGFEVPAGEEEEREVRRPVEKDHETEETAQLMGRRLKLREVEEYVRTWSSVHKWVTENPEVKRLEQKGDGFGNGDIVDEMFFEMAKVEGWESKEEEVDIAWGHGILLARRK
jgi:SAM-dependent methyltransferase